MDMRIDNLESCMVVELSGRFGADVSLPLGERINFEIEKRTGNRQIDFDIIVDMEKVSYISSGGIRVLLALHKRTDTAGRHLAICNLQTLVAKVISISGLFGRFDIYASVEDAKVHIGRS